MGAEAVAYHEFLFWEAERLLVVRLFGFYEKIRRVVGYSGYTSDHLPG